MTIKQTAAWLVAAPLTAFCIAPALTKSHTVAQSQSWSQPANFVSFGGTFETPVY
jgi:hypothetical protein